MNKNNITQLCVIYKKLTCKGRLKIKGWKKINHVNNNQKKAGVAILISDKIDFRAKTQEVHNVTRLNPPRRHSNPKSVCTNNRDAKCAQ